MNEPAIKSFQETLWQFYNEHGRRDLPWRQPQSTADSFNPYHILVSELMLQQTQVTRVIPKYKLFLATFPDLQSLATAPLSAVLNVWSGLGYNRRAKYLQQAAQQLVNENNGVFPNSVSELSTLPGVGKNTAGAIMAYAFNIPALFIETNVRTVYIHHFFVDQQAVSDAAILELVELSLDPEHPREFYWALMDYGSFLKQTIGNLSSLSAGYTKQSTFQGSRRQLRGQVLRSLGAQSLTKKQLSAQLSDDRLISVLEDLVHEGLIQRSADSFSL